MGITHNLPPPPPPDRGPGPHKAKKISNSRRQISVYTIQQLQSTQTEVQTVFDDDLFAFFFSTVLLKVSFNMFNWEMDFFFLSSSAEANKRQAAIEAVAKVTTTTMLRFSKRKKRKKRQPSTRFKVQLVTSYLSS